MTKKLKIGLTFFVLSALLTACSAKPNPPCSVPKPPIALIQETPEPTLNGKTNGDLVNWAIDLRTALRAANADKALIREWIDDIEAQH